MVRLQTLVLFQILWRMVTGANWEDWWTYDGISGPEYWGIMNPSWTLCSVGRRQSPVDVNPNTLLFDPNLKPVKVDKHRISGTVFNSGHSVVFRVDPNSSSFSVQISGGPFSYNYRFRELHLHFGMTDAKGSEHTVGGKAFPAELQLYGYNMDVYHNATNTHSMGHAFGDVAAISVLLKIGELSNTEMRILTSQLHKITHRGQKARLEHLSIRNLLPDTDSLMTYEGSLTTPGCYESVTWVVMNKPIYITKQQLHLLRALTQGYQDNPKAPLGNNFRPVFPIHNRAIRTNIDFRKHEGATCPTMERRAYYHLNRPLPQIRWP